MIVGAHVILYTTDAEADRAFFRDVLQLPPVDVGGGWLIFGLPPSEVAFHPSERNDQHEFFLMVDDVDAFVVRMAKHDVACEPVEEHDWGRLTRFALPGGGKVKAYQAKHARPPAVPLA